MTTMTVYYKDKVTCNKIKRAAIGIRGTKKLGVIAVTTQRVPVIIAMHTINRVS